MNSLHHLLASLNPLYRLGERKYSSKSPFFTILIACICIEVYIHLIVKNVASLGLLAIIIPVSLIVYFAARDGILGGLIVSTITIGYYFYIIFSLRYTGLQYDSAVATTIILGVVYLLLAFVIGWLKQNIDALVEKEKKARYIAEEGKLRLQTILAQLPVGVIMLDGEEKKFEANKEMEKIIGKKVNTATFRNKNYIPSFLYNSYQSLSPTEWPILRAFRTGEIIFEEEIEYVRSDKKRIFLMTNAAPIKNLQGKIVAAVSTMYDITQLKESEARKDDFINMASHELKTPITSMMLYLDTLISMAKNQDYKKIKQITGDIKRQTERLQKLTKDLLDVSLIQTGNLTFNKEKFSLNNLLSTTIATLRKTTSQKIVLSLKKSIVVNADKLRIEQVVTNLVNNALKYSQGRGSIVVSLHKEDDKAVVSVKDLGIGISESQQKNIFDKLYRVRENRGNTFPGFGMGLYIAKEIINGHAGDIWVKSKKGEGATFYFSLPLRKN
ncbi:MAG TPA: ATP-binding protein [Candidatus Eisenbacteria bacterium]|nr:ATP-binding protein [Candidatus Eisenbacteria bacterium]